MALVPAVAATATAVAGMYLNTRYSIQGDISLIRGANRASKHFKELCKIHGTSDWSFYHILHQTKGLNDYQEAFVFENRSWTYSEFRGEIGRVAQRFLQLGIRNRSVVGIFINNSPEFVFAWFALYKIGAVPAPVNTAIAEKPYRHCLKISEAEFLITSYELYDVTAKTLLLDAQAPERPPLRHAELPRLKSVIVYDYGGYPATMAGPINSEVIVVVQDDLPMVTPEMGDYSPETRPKVGPEDASQYLFTSGTTGLPKASLWPSAFSMMGAYRRRWPGLFEKYRRFYITMPMFHGGASFAVLPGTLANSGTIILARKFSQRHFWRDCRRSNANSILYVGEMIRYLVQAPPDPHHPDEKKSHGIELAYGLGLSPQVWRAFRERFGVPWIIEYYGASETTVSITNSNWSNSDGVGKVARWGPLMRAHQSSFYILKIDPVTGEIWRNPKTGLCKQAGFGETGEAICRIVPPLQRRHDYAGEGGAEATEKKTLRDVFKKGDVFFQLGDALSMDSRGYITFHDRLGDTYRTKGHNISTSEVEQAFGNHPDILSANVYSIPMNQYGYDGQVGCAAVKLRVDAPSSDSEECYKQIIDGLENWLISVAGLAPYAVPRFLRVLGTNQTKVACEDSGDGHLSLMMKKLKTGLRAEGFSIPVDSYDKMYWIKREGQGYLRLSQDTIQQLTSGRAML